MKEQTVLSVATETYSKPHHTAQKMKFSIKDIISNRFQRVWSYLLQKPQWKTSFSVKGQILNLKCFVKIVNG